MTIVVTIFLANITNTPPVTTTTQQQTICNMQHRRTSKTIVLGDLGSIHFGLSVVCGSSVPDGPTAGPPNSPAGPSNGPVGPPNGLAGLPDGPS